MRAWKAYDITFRGTQLIVDARVDGEHVQVASLKQHDAREPKTYHDSTNVQHEGDKAVALSLWTPEDRQELYALLRASR